MVPVAVVLRSTAADFWILNHGEEQVFYPLRPPRLPISPQQKSGLSSTLLYLLLKLDLPSHAVDKVAHPAALLGGHKRRAAGG